MKNNNHFLNIALFAAVAFSLVANNANAQVVAPTANIPTSMGTNLPVLYPGIKNLVNTGKYNYVRTITPDVPLSDLPSTSNYYRSGTDYFDGFGRPLQSVGRKSHADGRDIVQVHVYDSMGRESYQYLPMAGPLSGYLFNGLFGSIKLNDSSMMRYFYEQNGVDEPPYSHTLFDNSPLGRVVRSMPPGSSGIGSNKGVSYNYITNTNWSYNNGQSVYVLGGGFPIWTIANTAGALPVNSGQYAQGQLHITIAMDADGKSSMDVTDKHGKVVMKMANLTQNAWGYTRPSDYAYTIYVYDDLGRVRCVLPPEVAKPTGTTGNFTWTAVTQAQMDGLCYSYLYDDRGNVVEKKIPGKDVEYFVYDKRDRVAFSQDGNLRQQQKWAFTLYDALDRPYITALCDGGTATRLDLVNLMATYSSTSTTNGWYYIQNYNIYNTYPASLDGAQILSYIYYDDYSQLTGLGFDASQFNGVSLPSNNTVVPSVLSNVTRGLPTGSKVRVLDPDNPSSDVWLTTANYYDAKARVIQTVSRNLQNDIDISSNLYYFQGTLWKNILKHVNHNAVIIPGATDSAITNYTIVNTFERNFGIGGKGNDLVKKHTQKINEGPDYELSAYEYDHLGRNTLKQWTAGLNLQEFNMSGMINHIAFRKYNQDTAFNENLYYDRGFASRLYNGNIAGITWWGADHTKRAYGYTYDNLNRLNHAEFNQYYGTTWNKNQGVDFTASNISYDLNGNIKTMDQMGRLPLASTSIPMDALSYTYTANSNQLFNVKDAVSPSTTAALPDFKNDLTNNPSTVEEYRYDKNGNMVWDLNKKISSISYNYLNKPEKIIVDGKGSIAYTYDAAGNRLRKVTVDAVTSATDKWDYLGNFVYKNNELQYILNEEGRARPILASHDSFPDVPAGDYWTKFVYDYFVKDHLGNVRSTVTSKPSAYPYLAMHNISTANTEELIFDNIPTVRDTKPGSTNPDDMAARLNGAEADKRIGTAIMLHTNPGDHFTINVNAFYDGDYQQDDQLLSSADMVTSLMGTLMGGGTIGGPPVGELPQNQEIINQIFNNPELPGQMEELLSTNNNVNAPKAHLNYLWFNDHMELQMAQSGSLQVVQAPGWNVVSPVGGTVIDPGISSPGVGFLVVYIDNQSIGKDVWFDNLSLNMYTSEVLEEDHYYPFGLTVNTFTSTVGKNPYKLVTKELESKFDLNMYDFGPRNFDMTIGRWTGVDALADAPEQVDKSPYAGFWNNPVMYNDPDGNCPECYMNVKNPTEGQVYTSTGQANYTYTNGDWQEDGGKLDEVKVIAGSYFQGPYAYALDNSAGAGIFRTGFNYDAEYAAASGSAAGFSVEAHAKADDGIDIGASADALKADLNVRVGTEDLNVNGNANGNFLSASANIKGNVNLNKNGVTNVETSAEAGAYVAKGEYTGGINIFGVKFEFTQGGSVGSAHIGASGEAGVNLKKGTIGAEGSFHIGLGIGIKEGIKVEFPFFKLQ